MTTDDYEYLAEVWPNQKVSSPSALWRTGGAEPEYLSLLDWEWHAGAKEFRARPDGTFVAITADEAQALESDRQRLVRYWSYQIPNDEAEPTRENQVYRRRSSPEKILDEVFGQDNEWVRTPVIREFTLGSPADRPDLVAIDQAAAEQLIQQTRGITGATEL
ncbi:hypothetical protein E1263_30550 [Kribbella antibiotica]|uniref:Uncharacterized protein n=1 Tax=Kribbella antibiotica TaxID=190195 RepID=A0A4R4Z221_9ACTN|nr:hypothetical protein [Kribbella antibiotica]TDD50899.1 hypothetical protein E1263_30550 [Kribbella antibiotica]